MTAIPICGKLTNVPQGYQTLIPGSFKVTLYAPNMIKLRLLRWGDSPGLSRWTLTVIMWILKEKGGGKFHIDGRGKRWRGEGHVTMEAEMGVQHPRGKEYQELLTPNRSWKKQGRKDAFIEPRKGAASRAVKEYICCCFKLPGL